MHSFAPMFAEIADKMPNVGTLWMVWLFIGSIAGALTAALSLDRPWAGGVAVLMCAALGLLFAWPESMDKLVARELGAAYLLQQRLSGFVPFALSVASWTTVWLRRRWNKDAAAA